MCAFYLNLNVYRSTHTGALCGASDDVSREAGLVPQEPRPAARVVAKGHSALADLAVLALCCEHSVLSMGSFGWWAAFLREQSCDSAAAARVYHSDRSLSARV